MSRIRTIKPEWLDDEKMAALSDGARLLSVGLVLLADDHGLGRAHELFLASRVWSYGDAHETLTKVSGALRDLESAGFIRLYSVGGQRYYAIRNWTKHQKVQHATNPRVPRPEEADSPPPPRLLMSGSEEPQETFTPDPDLRSPIPITDPDHLSSTEASPPADTRTADVRRVFETWRDLHVSQAHRSRTKLDAKRRTRIRTRLSEGHTAETLVEALKGALHDGWLMGTDPKSPKPYRGLDTLLRDSAQVERLAALFREHGDPLAYEQTARIRELEKVRREAARDVRRLDEYRLASDELDRLQGGAHADVG